MKLYNLLKVIYLIFIGGFLFSCQIPKPSDRPNIILVLADDLGYGDLSCYGQKNFLTPNIDGLAKSGMKFTQHYTGAPVCAPARSVIVTGKHSGHTFVRGNFQNPNPSFGGQLPLPKDEITIGELLKGAGYKTGLFGKWGLGNSGTEGDPLNHGFDIFFGYHDQVLAHNSYPEFLMKDNQKVYLNNFVEYHSDTLWHKGLGSVSTKKIDYSNDLIFDEAIHFIEKNKKAPFFLYYTTTIPHDNGEAELGQRYEVPDASKFMDKDWKQDSKTYAALIEHLDMQIGKLVNKLEDLGLSDNTLIMFTSDNGPLPGLEHNSNGNLRGYKRDLYEGGIRVPLIVKWPKHIKPGTVSNHVSAFWDYLPTLSEIVGIKKSYDTDGISFLPTLLGEKQNKHEYLYWEFHWWGASKQAIRIGEWKFVKNNPNGKIELYNLVDDISESENLANVRKDLIDKWKHVFKTARTESEFFTLKTK